ncbi:hypothetical protein FGO68_gene7315 [Halteria grandinella]|uniref:Uncharacterized protein n=1 Tax=Halteria grandinella TaxID=5974 RepID=A0A8J8T589_HALGN|nr:hypothetical protein FGO68_gene7315 [Halteria grandinella]
MHDLSIFWKENQELIQELQRDHQVYKGFKKKTQIISSHQKEEAIILKEEIIEVLALFHKYKSDPSLAFKDLFSEPQSIALPNSIEPIQVLEIKQKPIISPQKYLTKLTSTKFHAQEVTKALLKEINIKTQMEAIEILKIWIQLLDAGNTQFLDPLFFSEHIYESQVIQAKAQQECILSALKILGITIAKEKIDQLENAAKLRKRMEKLDAKVEQLSVQDVDFNIDAIEAIYSWEEVQEIESEFELISSKESEESKSDGFVMVNESESSSYENSFESLSLSEKQAKLSSKSSVVSFFTVHSKRMGQFQNEHWKERLIERGKNIDEGMFGEIIAIIKDSLNNGKMTQSSKDPSRYIIVGPQGLKFVVQQTGQYKDGKQIYIPITVLAKYM